MNWRRNGFVLCLCIVGMGCIEDDSEDQNDGEDLEETEEQVESSTSLEEEVDLVDESTNTAVSYLVEPIQVTTGIRPIAANQIGLCRITANATTRDKRECRDYVSSDASELIPGHYVLKVNLMVPADGQEHPVRFVTDCRREGSDADRTERINEGNVSAGSADQGYRFWGLNVAVPEDSWASDCEWRLETGDHVFRGSWRFSVD